MADLKRQPRWMRFEPDFANNRELEPNERFFLEIASGLTKQQLADMAHELEADATNAKSETNAEARTTAMIAALERALGQYIKVGPLTVDGKAVEGLKGYLEFLVSTMADEGGFNIEEMTTQLRRINSFNGSRMLFYERLSGGGTSTQPPSTGLGGSQTAAPRSGSPISTTASSG